MSSSDLAIQVSQLSKRFEIYAAPRNRLKQFVLPPLQSLAGKPQGQYFSEFWALKDVSFDIKRGETVGIIGRNGSGKSTLLQLICGTLNPTSGSIKTSGRVAALLELGSGFNPEFTGRENVYLNATILFVSHSGGTIVELCDRAILLDAGECLCIGSPKQIVGRYQKLLYAPPDQRDTVRQTLRQSDTENAAPEAAEAATHTNALQESFDPNLVPSSAIEYESRGAHIQSPAVLTLAGVRVNNLVRARSYRYTYQVRFSLSASNVRFGMLIKTTAGMELGGGVTASSARTSLASVVAGACYAIEIRFVCALNPGVYFLNAGVVGDVDGAETYLHRITDITLFRVMPDAETLATGIVDFACTPELVLLPSPA